MMVKRQNLMIEFALKQAQLSKCKDKKTASILVSDDLTQIYSIGINGGPTRGKDCLCCDESTEKKKYSCVHSEMNCLVKNRVVDDEPKIMICTKQPCAMCASLIINTKANITEVWYGEDYWDRAGINMLIEAGIRVYKFEEVGNDFEIYPV